MVSNKHPSFLIFWMLFQDGLNDIGLPNRRKSGQIERICAAAHRDFTNFNRILLPWFNGQQCKTATARSCEICFSQSVRGYELRNRISCIILRIFILGN